MKRMILIFLMAYLTCYVACGELAYNLLREFSIDSVSLTGVSTVSRDTGNDTGIALTAHGYIVGDAVSIRDTGTKYDLAHEVKTITSANEFVIDTAFEAQTFTSGTVSSSDKAILSDGIVASDALWVPETNATFFTVTTKVDETVFIGSRHFYGLKWAVPAILAVNNTKTAILGKVLPSTIDITNSVITVRYYTDRPYFEHGSTNYHQTNVIYLGSNGNANDFYGRVSLPLSAGWHEVNIPISQLVQTIANPPDMTQINFIAFQYRSNATTDQSAFNVWFDDITITSTGRTKGTFMFTFDDAYLNHRTIAAPYLSARGYRSINYVEGNSIGTGSGSGERMTLAQVRESESLGMLPCGHWSGALFTTGGGDQQADKDAVATETRVRQWCEGIKAWMEDNGFTEGQDYLALPGGTGFIQTENHIKIMREYFAHIRGTTPWRRNGPYTLLATTTVNTSPQGFVGKLTSPLVGSEPWWGDATQIVAGAGFDSDMKAFVDACVDNGDLGVMFIHNIEPGGNLTDAASAGFDMNQTQFEAMVDYVKTKVDAGTLDVITYQDLISVQTTVGGGGRRSRYSN